MLKKNKLMMVLSIIMVMVLLASCGSKTGNEEGKEVVEENKAEENKDENKEEDKKEESNGKVDKNSLEGILEKGKLVVGTSADYPPYEFIVLEGTKEKYVGFDISLSQYIADELGVELEVMNMDFGNLIASIPAGKVDIVLAGMNPDEVRKKSVNFSEIYHKSTQGVLIKKENIDLIKVEEDLVGKKLGAQMGAIQEEIAGEIKDAEVKTLPLITNLLMELKTNKIDAIIMEKSVAESYAKQNEDLMAVEAIEIIADTEGSAIAIKKGNDELTEKINEILKDVEAKGLMDKWVVEAQEYAETLNE